MLPEPRHDVVGVFGTPSTLTYWGIHVIRTLVGVTLGHYDFLHGIYLADFGDIRGRAGSAQPLICVSDCPQFAACEVFVDIGATIFVFVEEPIDIIGDMAAASGIDPVAALRLATRSLCAIQPFLDAPAAIVMRKEHLDRTVGEQMAIMLASLRLAPTDAQRAEIDRLLSFPASGETLKVRDHINQHFPLRSQDHGETGISDAGVVQNIADRYNGLASGQAMNEIEWPSSIFSSGDRIGDYVEGPNDLIGPARILVYGPYMHLTRGDWSACVELEVSGNESGNQLKVDVVGGPDILASIIADLPVLGRYGFSVPFTVREPLEPIEMRFQIESGAIEGRFLLGKVVMMRLMPAAAAAVRVGAR